jgi:hypothetical protein
VWDGGALCRAATAVAWWLAWRIAVGVFAFCTATMLGISGVRGGAFGAWGNLAVLPPWAGIYYLPFAAATNGSYKGAVEPFIPRLLPPKLPSPDFGTARALPPPKAVGAPRLSRTGGPVGSRGRSVAAGSVAKSILLESFIALPPLLPRLHACG